MWVFHVDDVPAHDVINGQLITVNPREPHEIPSDFLAQAFMEHMELHGVVQINMFRQGMSFKFDVEDALERAEKALALAEQKKIEEYVNYQMERAREGRPQLPPEGLYERLVRKHGIDLARDYNIRPVGFRRDSSGRAHIQAAPVSDPRTAQMEGMLNALLGMLGPGVRESLEKQFGPVGSGPLPGAGAGQPIEAAPDFSQDVEAMRSQAASARGNQEERTVTITDETVDRLNHQAAQTEMASVAASAAVDAHAEAERRRSAKKK